MNSLPVVVGQHDAPTKGGPRGKKRKRPSKRGMPVHSPRTSLGILDNGQLAPRQYQFHQVDKKLQDTAPNALEDSDGHRDQGSENCIDRKLLVQKALGRYSYGSFLEKDLLDNLNYLRLVISQDLSSSLIDWELRLKEQRTANLELQGDFEKAFDPTRDSFTLWPLTVETCPKPDWTFEEEIFSLVVKSQGREGRAVPSSKIDQDDGDDASLVDELDERSPLVENVAETVRAILFRLFVLIYEYYPPPSTESTPQVPSTVASLLGIDQKIEQAVQDRLYQVYQVPDSLTTAAESSDAPPVFKRQRRVRF